MSKFSTPKRECNINKCAQKAVARFQCVNNYYAKFAYKGMETVGDKDYSKQTSLNI